jgi:hypothetical protein
MDIFMRIFWKGKKPNIHNWVTLHDKYEEYFTYPHNWVTLRDKYEEYFTYPHQNIIDSHRVDTIELNERLLARLWPTM